LNLAACHEAEKKLATAWLEYTQAETLARQDRREDRVRFAREHFLALEPRLARLTVTVDPDADLSDLDVKLDGVALKGAARGVPTPVDPGEHVIGAQAPGRKAWSKRVVIDREAQAISVNIPILEREAPPPVPTAQPEAPAVRPVVPLVVPTTRPIPAGVWVAGGATVLVAGAAAITGLVFLKERDRPTAQRSEDKQRSWGIVNGVLTGLAAVGAGTTVYLYVTRPSRGGPPVEGRFVGLAPLVAAGGGGFSIVGAL
jgi:hypothetical protein